MNRLLRLTNPDNDKSPPCTTPLHNHFVLLGNEKMTNSATTSCSVQEVLVGDTMEVMKTQRKPDTWHAVKKGSVVLCLGKLIAVAISYKGVVHCGHLRAQWVPWLTAGWLQLLCVSYTYDKYKYTSLCIADIMSQQTNHND